MRTFIALEMNEGIKDELARVQTTLKSSGADIKWVKYENMHTEMSHSHNTISRFIHFNKTLHFEIFLTSHFLGKTHNINLYKKYWFNNINESNI